MVTASRLTIPLALLCTLIVLPACEPYTRVVSEPWWNQLPADKPAGQADGQHAQGLWAIPLERFTGHDRQARARQLITDLQQQAGLRDLWSEDVDGTVTVYRGRFTDPGAEDARHALQHTRRVSLDNDRPFREARLTSLAGPGQTRITDPHDLRQYPGYYTLQIGFYDASYDGDFREAAEQAVRKLREDDHDAYFYHGPHRSLVTVGLFAYEEAFVTTDATAGPPQSQVDAYAPVIRELQKEFPHNRPNGRTRPARDAEGEDQQVHSSFVVRVF